MYYIYVVYHISFNAVARQIFFLGIKIQHSFKFLKKSYHHHHLEHLSPHCRVQTSFKAPMQLNRMQIFFIVHLQTFCDLNPTIVFFPIIISIYVCFIKIEMVQVACFHLFQLCHITIILKLQNTISRSSNVATSQYVLCSLLGVWQALTFLLITFMMPL